MIERLAQEIEDKYQALTQDLANPDVLGDQSRYTEVAKAHCRSAGGARAGGGVPAGAGVRLRS